MASYSLSMRLLDNTEKQSWNDAYRNAVQLSQSQNSQVKFKVTDVCIKTLNEGITVSSLVFTLNYLKETPVRIKTIELYPHDSIAGHFQTHEFDIHDINFVPLTESNDTSSWGVSTPNTYVECRLVSTYSDGGSDVSTFSINIVEDKISNDVIDISTVTKTPKMPLPTLELLRTIKGLENIPDTTKRTFLCGDDYGLFYESWGANVNIIPIELKVEWVGIDTVSHEAYIVGYVDYLGNATWLTDNCYTGDSTNIFSGLPGQYTFSMNCRVSDSITSGYEYFSIQNDKIIHLTELPTIKEMGTILNIPISTYNWVDENLWEGLLLDDNGKIHIFAYTAEGTLKTPPTYEPNRIAGTIEYAIYITNKTGSWTYQYILDDMGNKLDRVADPIWVLANNDQLAVGNNSFAVAHDGSEVYILFTTSNNNDNFRIGYTKGSSSSDFQLNWYMTYYLASSLDDALIEANRKYPTDIISRDLYKDIIEEYERGSITFLGLTQDTIPFFPNGDCALITRSLVGVDKKEHIRIMDKSGISIIPTPPIIYDWAYDCCNSSPTPLNNDLIAFKAHYNSLVVDVPSLWNYEIWYIINKNTKIIENIIIVDKKAKYIFEDTYSIEPSYTECWTSLKIVDHYLQFIGFAIYGEEGYSLSSQRIDLAMVTQDKPLVYVKNNNTWIQAKMIYIKNNDVWIESKGIKIKNNGNWMI